MHDAEERELEHWRTHWSGRCDGGHHLDSPGFLALEGAEKLSLMAGGGSLLDIGCGSAELLQHYLAAYPSCVGCEPSPAMLEEARRRIGPVGDERCLLLQHDDRTVFPALKGRTFDRVTCSQVIQYLPPDRVRDLMANAMGVLRPGGMIALFDIIDPRFLRHFMSGEYQDPPPAWWRRQVRCLLWRRVRLGRRLRGLPAEPMGRSYLPSRIAALAAGLGLAARFPRSAYYPYRYHAILTVAGG